MAGIESLSNQAMQFAAAQASARQFAQQAKKSEKATKLSFASSLQKSQAEAKLIEEGFPPELAGMTQEEAVIFLKDEVDIAGEDLKFHQSLENLENYRKKIGQFLKYISKNNYEVVERQKMVRSTGKRKKPTVCYIQMISQKMNKLLTDVIYNQQGNLRLLARIGEINGLIVDLLE